jgi:short-subunit dehydrogenase
VKAAGSRILLTGASGGIGQAAASALVKAGASLMLIGRSSATLSAQVRVLVHEHGVDEERVGWRAIDLLNIPELQALADEAATWRCNALIHAAGLPGFGPIESISDEEMQQVLHLNLLTPMLLTKALLAHLRAQPAAHVIFIGSALGRLGLPGYSLYSASKFGLRGFAESLRRELADTTVRVQYLGPRATRTDFNSAAVERYNRATGTATDPPSTVAGALLEMLETGQAERFLGFPEKLAVRLNGLAPTLLDGAFKRHRRSLNS